MFLSNFHIADLAPPEDHKFQEKLCKSFPQIRSQKLENSTNKSLLMGKGCDIIFPRFMVSMSIRSCKVI